MLYYALLFLMVPGVMTWHQRKSVHRGRIR